jgi:hypothetical protein
MPLLSQSSVGAISIRSSALNLVETVTFGTDTTTSELFIDNLPNLVFWIEQSGSGSSVQVVPQVALRSSTGGLSPSLEFIDLSAPVVLPAIGTPLLINYQFPAAFMRLKLIYTGVAPATQTVQVVLNAFGP